MNDMYCEYLVERTIRTKDIIVSALITAAAGILLSFVLSLVPVLLLAALIAWLNYVRIHVEYDYFLFNSDLEITPIYKKSFRGKKKSFDMRNAYRVQEYSGKGKKLDFSSGESDRKKLIFLVGEKKDTTLILETDEKMEKMLLAWASGR